MEKQLIENLEKFLSENELFRGHPASEKQIQQAEQELNIALDEDYKEFIYLFGGSYVGLPIYGFNNCDMLSDESVIQITEEFRKSYSLDDRWPKIMNSYVISMSGSGDPVIIDKNGKIIIYYHDSNEEEILSDSFRDLIASNIAVS